MTNLKFDASQIFNKSQNKNSVNNTCYTLLISDCSSRKYKSLNWYFHIKCKCIALNMSQCAYIILNAFSDL